jgi:Ca-activated chloride channel family protein
MKLINLIFILLLTTGYAIGQMTVNDPQFWCCDEEASIENVSFEVRPAGLYSEVSIAFDVYTHLENYYNSSQQLEFVYDFRMVENAVFNDSWLWINDYISLGEIYEKGEGTTIYEEIVDRRQDPSILTKVAANKYNLKIYPLFPDSTRRVRLSYFVPQEYYDQQLLTSLPMQFIDDSTIFPENISLTIYTDDNWYNEDVTNPNWIKTTEGADFTNYDYTGSTSSSTVIAYDYPVTTSSLLLGTYEGVNENYYQLLYLPEFEVEDIPEYYMLLIDYEKSRTNISLSTVLAEAKIAMQQLDDHDYFMIAYNKFTTEFSSVEWQPATYASINQAFDMINESTVSTNSKLSSTIPTCMGKIRDLGKDAKLNIVSSGVDFYKESITQAFINDINAFLNEIENEIVISVVDYATSKPYGWYSNGVTYRGNDYLYDNIAGLSNGTHHNYYAGDDLVESLQSSFSTEGVFTKDFDFDFNLENGFTYGNYFSTINNEKLIFNKPIIATGKYFGSGDFNIRLNGLYNGNYFSENETIQANETLPLDESARSIWHGEFILENEFNQSNNVKYDVINASIEERLLSFQTVFLCLEPDTTAISDNNGDDDDGPIVSTDDKEISNINITMYPNPFSESINIEIPAQSLSLTSEIYIDIFSMDGKLIERMNQRVNDLDNDVFNISWKPNDNLESGMYLIVVYSEDINYRTTVIYAR